MSLCNFAGYFSIIVGFYKLGTPLAQTPVISTIIGIHWLDSFCEIYGKQSYGGFLSHGGTRQSSI